MAKPRRGESLHSMTGYASLSGDCDTVKWDWELRSVNGKGLDVRMRLPDGNDALERNFRKAISAHATRGNVTVSLRVTERAAVQMPELDTLGLETALENLAAIEAAAQTKHVSLSTMTAADIAAMPGVMQTTSREKAGLPEEISAQIPELIQLFSEMRSIEGAALGTVMGGQLDAIEGLIDTASKTAEARSARQGDILRQKVAALTEATDAADPARLNQELAVLAVKSDVTEEIDRLAAHVAAARELLAKGGPVGRKLDFLMQEFNREANTLCSKSGSTELTATGLDMKVLIDQMREQVQNLE